MIPLRALVRIGGFPAGTLLLIAVNTLCFLFEQALNPYAQRALIYQYALVPDRVHITSLITSMFLHGGWMHLIGNMWFLWVFGSRVEDTLGSAKYLVYYVLCGVAAAVVHLSLNLGSPIPTLGASGAIAGVMGGFMLLYPRARIVTLIFIIFFVTTLEVPAVLLLLYWFAIQLFSGLFSFNRMSFTDAGGVAWFAHVGGFLAGMFLLSLFGGTSRRSSYEYRY
jgi:membrane associated rhomboid family serine protease